MDETRRKKILVTGGTGTFGTAFLEFVTSNTEDEIVIFSRDELKQARLALQYHDNPRVSFNIGDVRDKDSLRGAFLRHRPTHVVHAAAMKRIEMCENYPQECIKTNVQGSANVANVCTELHIRHLIAISTDKAVKPINAYGASKKLMEHIILGAGKSVIRYGNVVGSRGSVIPIWLEQADRGEALSVTDLTATRFLLRIKDAVRMTYDRMERPGLFLPEMKSTDLAMLAMAIDTDQSIPTTITGLGSFEKKHEDISEVLDSNTAPRLSYKELQTMVKEVKDELGLSRRIKGCPSVGCTKLSNKAVGSS